MTVLSLVILLSFVFSALISMMSLFMFWHVLKEFPLVRQLKNGRKALNTTLIALFITLIADAMRLAVTSFLQLLGIQNLLFIYLSIDIINIFRVVVLIGFIVVVLGHGKKTS